MALLLQVRVLVETWRVRGRWRDDAGVIELWADSPVNWLSCVLGLRSRIRLCR